MRAICMCLCPGVHVFIVCVSVNEQLYVCMYVCVCALVQNRKYATFGAKCRWSLCVIFKQCVACHSVSCQSSHSV